MILIAESKENSIFSTLFQPSGHRPVYIQHRATVHVVDRRKKSDTLYLKLETQRAVQNTTSCHIISSTSIKFSCRSFQLHRGNFMPWCILAKTLKRSFSSMFIHNVIFCRLLSVWEFFIYYSASSIRIANKHFRVVDLSVFNIRYYFHLRDYVVGRRNRWPMLPSVT